MVEEELPHIITMEEELECPLCGCREFEIIYEKGKGTKGTKEY